jgi:hypothetical protein
MNFQSLISTDSYRDELLKCLDGSTSGYYLSNTAGASTHGMVIYFVGGGFCGRSLSECATPDQLKKFSTEGLPTKTWGYNLLSNNPDENTAFSSHMKVLIPYCSGDVYLANASILAASANDGTTRKLHFRGAAITEAVVHELRSRYFRTGTNAAASKNRTIIVHGSSAGGLAVMNHMKMVETAFDGYPVKAVVDSAWFFMPMPVESGVSAEFLIGLNLPSLCYQDGGCCMSATCMIYGDHYASPTFWIQSRFDPYALYRAIVADKTVDIKTQMVEVVSSYMADAGKYDMLATYVAKRHTKSVVMLFSCAEHVLMQPCTVGELMNMCRVGGTKMGQLDANNQISDSQNVVMECDEDPYESELVGQNIAPPPGAIPSSTGGVKNNPAAGMGSTAWLAVSAEGSFPLQLRVNIAPNRAVPLRVGGTQITAAISDWDRAGAPVDSKDRKIAAAAVVLNSKDEHCSTEMNIHAEDFWDIDDISVIEIVIAIICALILVFGALIHGARWYILQMLAPIGSLLVELQEYNVVMATQPGKDTGALVGAQVHEKQRPIMNITALFSLRGEASRGVAIAAIGASFQPDMKRPELLLQNSVSLGETATRTYNLLVL